MVSISSSSASLISPDFGRTTTCSFSQGKGQLEVQEAELGDPHDRVSALRLEEESIQPGILRGGF